MRKKIILSAIFFIFILLIQQKCLATYYNGDTIEKTIDMSLGEKFTLNAKDFEYKGVWTSYKCDYITVIGSMGTSWDNVTDISKTIDICNVSAVTKDQVYSKPNERYYPGKITFSGIKEGTKEIKIGIYNAGAQIDGGIEITLKLTVTNYAGELKKAIQDGNLKYTMSVGSGANATQLHNKIAKLMFGEYKDIPLTKSTGYERKTEKSRNKIFTIKKVYNGKIADLKTGDVIDPKKVESKMKNFNNVSSIYTAGTWPTGWNKGDVANSYCRNITVLVEVNDDSVNEELLNGKSAKKKQEWIIQYKFLYSSKQFRIFFGVSPIKYKKANGEQAKDTQGLKEAEKSEDDAERTLKNFAQNFNEVFGDSDRDEIVFTDVIKNVNDYKPKSSDMDDESAKKIEDITSKILTVISNIGIAVSVIILAAIGVKYMIGSIEERAEYKKDLIPYVIGAVMLFGITTVMKIVMAIGDKINSI